MKINNKTIALKLLKQSIAETNRLKKIIAKIEKQEGEHAIKKRSGTNLNENFIRLLAIEKKTHSYRELENKYGIPHKTIHNWLNK